MRFEVARYEAERRSTGALVAALGLSLFAGLFLAIGPSLVAQVDLESLIEAYPPALRRAFGLDGFGSFAGLLATELYQFGWVLLLGVYFAYAGGGSVAGDLERGRLDMLLSTPLSRSWLVGEKFLALAWPLLVVNVVVFAVVAAGLPVVGESIPLADLAMVHLLSVPYLLAVTALGVLASTLVDHASVAQRISAGLVFGLFLLNSFVEGSEYEALGALSPTRYYDPTAILVTGEWDLAGGAILLGATAVLLGAAVSYFRRRDL
jgi:ABC-2 type transport system permease protein